MNFLAQLLSEIQPFEVREIATFSQKIYIFDTNVKISQGRLEISKNELEWLVGLQKSYSKWVYTTLWVKGGLDWDFFSTATFSQNFNVFDGYVGISHKRLGISRNGLDWVVGIQNCYSKCVYRTL